MSQEELHTNNPSDFFFFTELHFLHQVQMLFVSLIRGDKSYAYAKNKMLKNIII